MALPMDQGGAPHILIALTPGANAHLFVEHHGLKISDFGPADGSADILPLLAMQQEMLEDGKRKSAKLMAARTSAEHLANHDVLTELPNRRALLTGLTAALAHPPLSILHVDLDRFKEINDTHGHAASDAALRDAAASMQHVLGADTLCARLRGGEFVGLVQGAPSDAEIKDLAEDVIRHLSEPFSFSDMTLNVGVSIGIARTNPDQKMTADDILHHADLALYEVKCTGRTKALMCTPELFGGPFRVSAALDRHQVPPGCPGANDQQYA